MFSQSLSSILQVTLSWQRVQLFLLLNPSPVSLIREPTQLLSVFRLSHRVKDPLSKLQRFMYFTVIWLKLSLQKSKSMLSTPLNQEKLLSARLKLSKQSTTFPQRLKHSKVSSISIKTVLLISLRSTLLLWITMISLSVRTTSKRKAETPLSLKSV